MSRFNFIHRLVNWMIYFTQLPTMRSLRTALIFTTPILVAGSFAILINNLPIEGYADFMTGLFGHQWHDFGAAIWNATFGIMSVVVVFTVSQQLIRSHNAAHPFQIIHTTIPTLISVVVLFILISRPDNTSDERLRWMGVGGLFVALFVAILATKCFIWLANIRWLRLNVGAAGSDLITGQVLDLLLPGLIVIGAVSLLDTVVFSQGENMHTLFTKLVSIPFENPKSELGTGILYAFICQMAWFFGIHGPNLLDPVTHTIYVQTFEINKALGTFGYPLPYTVTKPFFDVFIYLGGSGCTLGLIIAILIKSYRRSVRKIAQISSFPALLNVNELLIFGLPLILNPLYLIPFVGTPMVLTVVSYIAFKFNFVPGIIENVSWTTPPILSGYLATGSIKGSLLQVINLVIAVLCYLPFVALADRVALERLKATLGEIFEISASNSNSVSNKKYIHRHDEVGIVARALSQELQEAIKKKDGEVFLVYQPQVCTKQNRVVGVEALVRWRHPVYGMIAPPISIGLAEDAEFINELGLKILDDACIQQKKWYEQGLKDVLMSVNISVQQLQNPNFEQDVLATIKANGLPNSAIKIEVTESLALTPDAPSNKTLVNLNKHGVRLAIDDFGMGHSTLVYFKQFPVSTLKIDQALSRDVLNSKTSAEIIGTVVSLCESIDADVVVEFVDNVEQLKALHALGCHIFQGYFFSPPLSADECLDYIKSYPKNPFILKDN